MSDEIQSWIEPELEARLVAMLLGEASDFEIEELERLMGERPELTVLRRRLEAVQGLLVEPGVVKPHPEDQESESGEVPWQLSSEKRTAILALTDEEESEEREVGREEKEGGEESAIPGAAELTTNWITPANEGEAKGGKLSNEKPLLELVSGGKKRPVPKRRWLRVVTMTGLAAALLILLFVISVPNIDRLRDSAQSTKGMQERRDFDGDGWMERSETTGFERSSDSSPQAGTGVAVNGGTESPGKDDYGLQSSRPETSESLAYQSSNISNSSREFKSNHSIRGERAELGIQTIEGSLTELKSQLGDGLDVANEKLTTARAPETSAPLLSGVTRDPLGSHPNIAPDRIVLDSPKQESANVSDRRRAGAEFSRASQPGVVKEGKKFDEERQVAQGAGSTGGFAGKPAEGMPAKGRPSEGKPSGPGQVSTEPDASGYASGVRQKRNLATEYATKDKWIWDYTNKDAGGGGKVPLQKALQERSGEAQSSNGNSAIKAQDRGTAAESGEARTSRPAVSEARWMSKFADVSEGITPPNLEQVQGQGVTSLEHIATGNTLSIPLSGPQASEDASGRDVLLGSIVGEASPEFSSGPDGAGEADPFASGTEFNQSRKDSKPASDSAAANLVTSAGRSTFSVPTGDPVDVRGIGFGMEFGEGSGEPQTTRSGGGAGGGSLTTDGRSEGNPRLAEFFKKSNSGVVSGETRISSDGEAQPESPKGGGGERSLRLLGNSGRELFDAPVPTPGQREKSNGKSSPTDPSPKSDPATNAPGDPSEEDSMMGRRASTSSGEIGKPSLDFSRLSRAKESGAIVPSVEDKLPDFFQEVPSPTPEEVTSGKDTNTTLYFMRPHGNNVAGIADGLEEREKRIQTLDRLQRLEEKNERIVTEDSLSSLAESLVSKEEVVLEEEVAKTGYQSEVANRESARRQEIVHEARVLIEDGDADLDEKDYKKSIDSYENALGLLSKVPNATPAREAAIAKHSKASIALASERYKEGYLEEAKQVLDATLSPDLDPDNVAAKRLRANLDDPEFANPAFSAAHVENVKKQRKQLDVGRAYYELGDFEAAEKEIYGVLRKDKHNKAARRWLERIEQSKSVYYQAAYDHTRRKMLNEIDELWETSVPLNEENAELSSKEVQVPQGQALNEKRTLDEIFSTFSLNVSDVAFKLAQASLAKGKWPDAASVRAEEFVNAMDYSDPLPSMAERVSFQIEQASHPFLQERNIVRLSLKTAALGRNAATPLRITLLLDRSGSMERHDRKESVRRAVSLLAEQLSAGDKITLIGFSRQPQLLAEQIAGENAAQLVNLVDQLSSEGGTNLEEALKLAWQKSKEQHLDGAQNRIILMTDGAANLGNAKPDELADIIKGIKSSGVAFDACGVGADGLNDEILESLTRNGDGRYYLLDRPEDADAGFARQIAGALRPAAKNVKVQIKWNPQRVERFRLYGFEKHLLKKEDFRNDAVDAAEIAAEEAGVAVYHAMINPSGKGDLGRAFVRFQDAASGKMVEKSWLIPYQASTPSLETASPPVQLAGTAALFAEKLKGGAMGELVELDTLAKLAVQLRSSFAGEPRVAELQQMIQQARNIEGQP